jgi:predicted lipoprotein
MRGWCVAAACLVLSSCVPWTVRPLEDVDDRARSFDAAAYVDSIWQSKVLPAAEAAHDWNAAHCASPCLVRGQGRVVRVDTSSRAGMAFLDSGIAVQIGPVIRGTALRDALPFIRFSQFTNQLEFARVGNALNDRATQILHTPHVTDDIAFTGALETGSPVTVVPVTLTLVRRGAL